GWEGLSEKEWMNRGYHSLLKNGNPNFVFYDYLIGADGTILKNRPSGTVQRPTRNNNVGGIHIALVGNFEKYSPKNIQYESLNKLIREIKNSYTIEKVMGHGNGEGEQTSCPGKLFDRSLVDDEYEPKKLSLFPVAEAKVLSIPKETPKPVPPKIVRKKKITDPNYLGEFTLSRYYSVMIGQERYYKGKTYEEDFKINCHGDCLVPADGKQYSEADIGVAYACPKELPFGTKIRLEFSRGITYGICRDRGSAITSKRLDAWCGIGMQGLTNIEQGKGCFTGKAKIYKMK
ncbi:MAG TPA: N-acetylmuramoyl-L-alanine amidase, partial [Candidatus Absconditabacterales bacterium]|nr:N-acetylmuramoyl-L-alanine amidase [Candidatus Absconditabacterales bacterium]